MHHLAVCQKLKDLNTPEGNFAANLNLQRAEFGLKKYGVGLDRKDLKEPQWLLNALEEALDLANYLEVVINISNEDYVPQVMRLQNEIVKAAADVVAYMNQINNKE